MVVLAGLLFIYAVASAIEAAKIARQRVQQRQLQPGRQSAASKTSVRKNRAQQSPAPKPAQPSIAAPARASATQPVQAAQALDRSPSERTQGVQSEHPPSDSLSGNIPVMALPLLEDLVDTVKLEEMPLAASLSVSDVVQQDFEESAESTNPDSSETQKAEAEHHAHNLLADISKIGEMEQRDRQIEQLAKYVLHEDSLVRSAAALTLGELATSTQGKELEEIVSLLDQLSHDEITEVRQRAIAALGTLPIG